MVKPVLPMCRRLLAGEVRGLRQGIRRTARRQLHTSSGKSNAFTDVHLPGTEAIHRSLTKAIVCEPQHIERKLHHRIPSWPIPYWNQLDHVSFTKCISECRGRGFDLYAATKVLVEEMQKRNMQLVDEYAGRHLPAQLKTRSKLVWRAKPRSPQLQLPQSLATAEASIKQAHRPMENSTEMQMVNVECAESQLRRSPSTGSDADSLPPPPPPYDDFDETATVYAQSDADSWILSQPASTHYGSASIVDGQGHHLPKRKRESGRIRQRRKLRLQGMPGTDDESF